MIKPTTESELQHTLTGNETQVQVPHTIPLKPGIIPDAAPDSSGVLIGGDEPAAGVPFLNLGELIPRPRMTGAIGEPENSLISIEGTYIKDEDAAPIVKAVTDYLSPAFSTETTLQELSEKIALLRKLDANIIYSLEQRSKSTDKIPASRLGNSVEANLTINVLTKIVQAISSSPIGGDQLLGKTRAIWHICKTELEDMLTSHILRDDKE